ncbi:hypothetical protein D1007_61653 [Hordeum vulgare]|nr:hypothetical protein D1007_61653 [Hordeum vulgare]
MSLKYSNGSPGRSLTLHADAPYPWRSNALARISDAATTNACMWPTAYARCSFHGKPTPPATLAHEVCERAPSGPPPRRETMLATGRCVKVSPRPTTSPAAQRHPLARSPYPAPRRCDRGLETPSRAVKTPGNLRQRPRLPVHLSFATTTMLPYERRM